MKYKVEKKYLVLPTSRWAKEKNVSFHINGECVYDVDIRLDSETPERDVYLDMERFVGCELEISVFPEMKLEIKQKERKPLERFRQHLRPKYHFTAPEGWINDPNGLLYSECLYHMFYQLNPCDVHWNNMHWGYAVSRNLYDWEHKPIKLFPDKTGAMFSGSAQIDVGNIFGFNGEKRKTVVLYYTAAGSHNKASEGVPFEQYMAISTDSLESFVKQPKPIVPHIVAGNRDPNVVYSDSLRCYVMALYLEADRYLVLTSKNHTDWEQVFEISVPGDSECPEFFPLKNEKGEEKWIFTGAKGRYFVGRFDGVTYVTENSEPYVFNYTSPKSVYAAQHFKNTESRVIRTAWMKTDFSPYGMPFNGAMTLPQETRLVSTEKGDRIAVSPVKETEKLHTKKVKLSGNGNEHSYTLKGIAHDIIITIEAEKATYAEIHLFGQSYRADFVSRTFTCGEFTIPMQESSDGKFGIRLLTDTCGVEVFLSDGRAYGAFVEIPDGNLCNLEICADSDIKLRGDAFRMRDARFSDGRK